MQFSDSVNAPQPHTPAFVIDQPLLEDFLSQFQRAMAAHWPASILGYSFKTNALPWLVTFMRDRGAWAEVVSDTEYELALALGFEQDHIVFNGPAKSYDRLRSSLLAGSVVNLDSKREVTWTAELARETPELELAVGLRINWDLAARVPGETTSADGKTRFGFNVDNGEFDAAVNELTAAGVHVAGLHLHNNSKTQSLEVYRAAATVAAELITSYGLSLDWIDIGGGFFGGVNAVPTFDDYLSAIREVLDDVVDVEQTCLILEPGGALVAVPIEYHATIVDVKDVDDTRFVVMDGSRTDVDPLFRRTAPYEMSIEAAAEMPHPRQHLVGASLMDGDRVTVLHDQPELQVGDRLVFYKLGAYTMCLKGLFIDYLPNVYVRAHEELTMVRRKWGAQEFLQANVWSGGGDLGTRTSEPRTAVSGARPTAHEHVRVRASTFSDGLPSPLPPG